ncbi:hypothetical protein B0T36_03145 [Nocardia donostiensis]|uniref:hypothetical protein n=1 Tax=Nocardia donostiensis TaxID=1538463 RepID=UPI0009DA9EBF|nr:hypothetical protein [Nocardia donostiensis]OQS16682.1 hypothetical protein B0T36_03145 [Nocardia donostiensis]
MSAPLSGDTTQIVSVADYATAVQGEYEGYLRGWYNAKDEFQAHVRSKGLGDTIQVAMQDAHDKGSKIVKTMDEILTVLKQSGAAFSNVNLDAAQQVRAASLGNNGAIDTGTW